MKTDMDNDREPLPEPMDLERIRKAVVEILRAIVEDLLADKRQVTLLYSARNEKGLALRQELESLTANPDFRLVLILSHDETWAGEKGKLDEEKIARLVSNVAEHEVFLCGPPPMMAATRKTLEKLGVHPGKIFTEEFAL